MQVSFVYVHLKAGNIADFIEACRLNHEVSAQEPGNARFDVIQLVGDATRFVLYETYASAADAAAYMQTAHYLAWRETVADWMVDPPQGVSYRGLFPKV